MSGEVDKESSSKLSLGWVGDCEGEYVIVGGEAKIVCGVVARE